MNPRRTCVPEEILHNEIIYQMNYLKNNKLTITVCVVIM